ncbi:MAG: nucleotidyltransferase domain-containing protein [Leptospiraceae bacterium]|nr:nucleotidyltransferase domain-containing protein [Leptospiraceae bacterium]
MNQLKLEKEKFEKEGLVIVGVFGSFARGDERADSDLDLLFEDSIIFKESYKGLKRVYRLEGIKKELEHILNRKVDLVNKNTLGEIAKKYILKKVVNV